MLWTPTYVAAYATAFNYTITVHEDNFIHTINISVLSIVYASLLTTDQNEFKNRLKPQKKKILLDVFCEVQIKKAQWDGKIAVDVSLESVWDCIRVFAII